MAEKKHSETITITSKKIPASGIGQWTMTLSDQTWSDIIKQAEQKAINELQIAGFRKGKVPTNIAKKHISESTILKNAANKGINTAFDFGSKQENLDVQATSKPEVKIDQISLTECTLTFNFVLPLQINITKLDHYQIEKPVIEPSQEEIQQQINMLKDRYAVLSTKENGVLELGDVAVFDFRGTVAKEEFAGNHADNAELEIGSNRFIPGFETQMIGMKVNEKKTINVTFPKDYHIAKLAGQEAEFALFIKEVKTKIISESNEELIKDLNIPEVKTYEQLITYITEQLKKEKNKTVHDNFISDYMEKVVEKSEIVIPHSVVQKETERVFDNFKKQLLQQNVDLNKYKEMTGLSESDILREAQKDAMSQLYSYIICEEIIKQKQITAETSEIDQYLATISAQTKMPLEEVKTKIQDLSFVERAIKQKKAFEWIWDHNGIEAKNEKK